MNTNPQAADSHTESLIDGTWVHYGDGSGPCDLPTQAAADNDIANAVATYIADSHRADVARAERGGNVTVPTAYRIVWTDDNGDILLSAQADAPVNPIDLDEDGNPITWVEWLEVY
jgi:hypothetical protein